MFYFKSFSDVLGFDNNKSNAISFDANKFKVSPFRHRKRVFYDFDNATKINRTEFESCNNRLWETFETRKQVKNYALVYFYNLFFRESMK